MELKKASRKQVKMRLALSGPSGSGKTMSALKLAKGLVGSWDKIAVIDTENGSSELYSNLGDFNVIQMVAPYSPSAFMEALQVCEQAGMEAIIIDSMSAEWEKEGGILSMADAMTGGNDYTKWGKITPKHNKFVDSILHSPAHVICTLRSKTDVVLVMNDKGKQVPQKMGLKAVTREGVDYEFTLVFDLDIKHNATASKDRTSLYMDADPFIISEATGKKIYEWCQLGITDDELHAQELAKVLDEVSRISSRIEMDAVWKSSSERWKENKQFMDALAAKAKEYPKPENSKKHSDHIDQSVTEAGQTLTVANPTAANPHPMTINQKTQILLLLNNSVFEAEDKQSRVDQFKDWDTKRADLEIANLKKFIRDKSTQAA